LTWGDKGDLIPFESAMHRMGFRDDELKGKGFAQFEAKTKEQKAAVGLAQRYAAGELSRPGLFLCGSAGRGKTHLARAIAEARLIRGLGFRYKRIQDLVADCKLRMQRDSTETPESHVQWFCDFPGLLILDEIGRTSASEWLRDSVMYPLVDQRKGKPTIFISNYDLDQLAEKYDEAITSRLQLCTVMMFNSNMEDYRKR